MKSTKSSKKTSTSSKDDFIFEEKTTLHPQLIDYISKDEIHSLFRTVMKMAERGEWPATNFVGTRIFPPRDGCPIKYNIPKINSLEDAEEALSKVIEDMSKGEISAQEAKNACDVIKTLSGIKETRMLDERSKELTNKLPSKSLKI